MTAMGPLEQRARGLLGAADLGSELELSNLLGVAIDPERLSYATIQTVLRGYVALSEIVPELARVLDELEIVEDEDEDEDGED